MRCQRRERLRELSLEFRRPRDEAFALDDVEVRERRGACRSVPGVRVAVAPDDAAAEERLRDVWRDDDRTKREAAGRDSLRAGDHVRLEAEPLRREPAP